MSWYGTCGVSNLPITYGNEVALFILKEFDEEGSQWRGSFLGGLTYPDELFNPVVPPVFGEYNSYGTINNIEDKGNIVFEYLESRIGVEKGNTNLEGYIESIERGNVDKYSLMLVHKEVYIKVVEDLYNYRAWFTGDKTFGDKLEKDTEEYLICVEDYVKSSVNNYKNEGSSKEETESLKGLLVRLYTYEGSNIFSEGTQHYLKNFRDYREYKQKPELKSVMINFIAFKKAMELGRKVWSPQSGAGSQTEYYGMASIVGDFTKAKIKELEELDN